MSDAMQKVAVIGKDQHPLGFQIQATGWEDPGIDDPLGQHVHHRQSIMGVVGAGDRARGLVEHDGHVFGGLDLFAVENDLILPGKDADAQLSDLTIDVDETFFDEEFSSSAAWVIT